MLKRTYSLVIRPLGKQAKQLAVWRLELAMELGLPSLELHTPHISLGEGSTLPGLALLKALRSLPWPPHVLESQTAQVQGQDLVFPLKELIPGSSASWWQAIQKILSPWPTLRSPTIPHVNLSLGSDPSLLSFDQALIKTSLASHCFPTMDTLGSMEILVLEILKDTEAGLSIYNEYPAQRIKKYAAMEYFDLYQRDRTPLGIKVIRGSKLKTDQFHLVAMGIIQIPGNRYIITQRSKHKIAAGKWECTAGSVISGETSKTAVLREIKEELGISVEIVGGPYIEYCEGQSLFDIYHCTYNGPLDAIKVQETEVQDCMAATLETIQSLIDQGLGTKSFTELVRLIQGELT